MAANPAPGLACPSNGHPSARDPKTDPRADRQYNNYQSKFSHVILRKPKPQNLLRRVSLSWNLSAAPLQLLRASRQACNVSVRSLPPFALLRQILKWKVRRDRWSRRRERYALDDSRCRQAMAVTLIDPVAIIHFCSAQKSLLKCLLRFKQELSWPKDARFAGKARTTEM